MINLKIVSDGSPVGTSLVDKDTGERIDLPVTHIEWSIGVGGLPQAKVVFAFAAADIDIPLENVTLEAVPNTHLPYFNRDEVDAQQKLSEAIVEYVRSRRKTVE